MRDFVVNHLLDGFLLTAFPIAVIAGVISFVSPCVLPLVPGYLSFAAGFRKLEEKFSWALFSSLQDLARSLSHMVRSSVSLVLALPLTNRALPEYSVC